MKLLITSALVFLAVSPLVLAKHQANHYHSNEHSHGEFKAKVLSSTPIYKYVNVSPQKTYCEPTVIYKNARKVSRKAHYQSHDESHNNKGAAIIGGIVGGFIGHATSNRKHKGLGTIVGAVIGSSLAHNIVRASNIDSRNYHVQQRNCVVRYKKNDKMRVLQGYKVTYRAQGELYQTFRQNKPARYIRIYN